VIRRWQLKSVPMDMPKLTDYQPTRFMLPTSHYDARRKADRAVKFIEMLRHTKGKWAGKRFWLLPWQEQIVRDLFGIIKPDGNRQFRTAYIEIGKKNGKSELAAAVALYLLYADNEPSAEVYGAAADRQQASIVFDVAHQMVNMTPALLKRSKIMAASKRIVNYSNAGFYQVLSAEVGTKHGLNVSGLVFDEVHAQPTRRLFDVLTQGSGDAREQPLYFLITTAGTDKNSICYELHQKAKDILSGQRVDHTFYPVVYGLEDDEDWHDEKNWYKANPSLGQTIDIERVREHYHEAMENPAEEAVFKQLRLNMWVSSTTAFIPEQVFDQGNEPIDLDSLQGRECYGGLDLTYGQFGNAGDRFMGFKFDIDGSLHYGWARLNITINPVTVTVKGYAYDDIPNNPIIAGDLGVSCDVPDIDGTYNIMPSSAKLKWFAVDAATKYQLKYRKVGTATWTKLNVSGTQKTITGLECNVAYEWNVKSKCGDLFSAFSPLQTFTTAVCKIGELSSTEIDVYPNPASDAVYLDLQGLETTSIVAISDINGKQMVSDFIIEDGIMQVDIHDYPAGIYLLQIQTSTDIKTIKFVKQ
jgi:hypothetical protein